MYDMLAAQHRQRLPGEIVFMLGHHDACIEIRDLLTRFPTWRDAIQLTPELAGCLPR